VNQEVLDQEFRAFRAKSIGKMVQMQPGTSSLIPKQVTLRPENEINQPTSPKIEEESKENELTLESTSDNIPGNTKTYTEEEETKEYKLLLESDTDNIPANTKTYIQEEETKENELFLESATDD
jgi:hypothetical protein